VGKVTQTEKAVSPSHFGNLRAVPVVGTGRATAWVEARPWRD